MRWQVHAQAILHMQNMSSDLLDALLEMDEN